MVLPLIVGVACLMAIVLELKLPAPRDGQQRVVLTGGAFATQGTCEALAAVVALEVGLAQFSLT